jgi:hypothetical protein
MGHFRPQSRVFPQPVQSGRKYNGINVGFSPCGNFFGYFGRMQAFFRSLFSRAENGQRNDWALLSAA